MHRNLTETLRWMAVLPWGLLAGFLVLFPLHWILYISLVKSDVVQMSLENVASVERFISPALSAVIFVYAGSMVAPRKKVLVSYIMFSIGLLARIGMLIATLARHLEVDTSASGMARVLVASVAGAFGILLVSLNEKEKTCS